MSEFFHNGFQALRQTLRLVGLVGLVGLLLLTLVLLRTLTALLLIWRALSPPPSRSRKDA